MEQQRTRRRRRLPIAERTDLWARWKVGESLSDIGRALGRAPGTIFTFLAVQGGIARAPRRRAVRALTTAEREQISRGLAAAHSLRTIAGALQRSPSTISREVARHGGRTRYRAVVADARAWRRAERPKRCRLSCEPELRAVVAAK